MWPLKPRASRHHAKCIIALVWTVAVITAFPILLVTTLEQPSFWHQECGFYICNEKWPSENVRHYYNVALLVLQYCIPFAVLLFTYVNIGVVVWGKRTPGEAQNSRDVRMAKSKRKVTLSDKLRHFESCHILFSNFPDDKNDGYCGHSVHGLLATV
ncbi:unnamed protein product [Macrosiphum euphorbiae]|uniref:G-protein coupled receptors family 1 profile domain-containing protein n=1 Tax=Macrosiphum euphorbiae TaxID=13131 RepID=A0AAV0XMJ8_9HEMI|nr:unnamed protein product [Macrosiphum euphorbiae]